FPARRHRLGHDGDSAGRRRPRLRRGAGRAGYRVQPNARLAMATALLVGTAGRRRGAAVLTADTVSLGTLVARHVARRRDRLDRLDAGQSLSRTNPSVGRVAVDHAGPVRRGDPTAGIPGPEIE